MIYTFYASFIIMNIFTQYRNALLWRYGIYRKLIFCVRRLPSYDLTKLLCNPILCEINCSERIS